MKEVYQTRHFRKDLKRQRKRGKNLDKLKAIITRLVEVGDLDPKYHDHPLTGEWAGSRDCHVEPDWILIYRLTDDALYLERTGTHSDLFK